MLFSIKYRLALSCFNTNELIKVMRLHTYIFSRT